MKRAYEIFCVTSRMEVEADARHLPQLLFVLPFRKGSLASLELSFSRELLFPPPTHRYVLPRLASHLAAGDLNSWGLWPEGKHFTNSPTFQPHVDSYGHLLVLIIIPTDLLFIARGRISFSLPQNILMCETTKIHLSSSRCLCRMFPVWVTINM